MYQRLLKWAANFIDIRLPLLLEGEGSVLRLPRLLTDLKFSSVLIATDKFLRNSGLLTPLLNKLAEENIKYFIYDGVVPNPTISNVEEAYRVYGDNKCQAIIAFGGGSPLDCAKAVAARVANPLKSIEQMRGLLKVRGKTPTLFAVPTTAGTGSEATLAAVISNPAKKEKYALTSPKLMPRYAILDPSLTYNLPPQVTAATGIDALAHALEAYIGKSGTKLSDKYALEALQLIFDNLETAYFQPLNVNARKAMSLAAYKAGVSFTRAYVGNVHAIAHTFGAFYNEAHGIAIAVVLPRVLDFYGDAITKKLAEIALYIGLQGNSDAELSAAFTTKLKTLLKTLNLPDKLSLREEDIPLMIAKALREANPLYPSPVIMDYADMRTIYDAIKK